MKATPILLLVPAILSLSFPACNMAEGEHSHEEHHKIVATSPLAKDIVSTQRFVCQIHSQRHIDVCALENGFLLAIPVKEGQAVKQGDLLFKINPTLYQAKLETELAEVKLAQREYDNTKRLVDTNVVSPNELALYEAKLRKAEAKAKLAQAELDFTEVKAPFDGIVDRLLEQQGSLVKEGESLTTLSDNTTMWVYFNVPEAQYLEYKTRQGKGLHSPQQLELVNSRIELVLANGIKFGFSASNVVTVEGQFNNETGNIPFRADFANPDALLRHGQTGNVVVHKTVKNALVIPQRATYEILDKRYVYVIDKDDMVRQREIIVESVMEDVFIIQSGLTVDDKIVLEGVRQVHDGEKVEAEFVKPGEVIADQKKHAE